MKFWLKFASIIIFLQSWSSVCNSYSILSYDIDDGEILVAKNELGKVFPASITKVMTVYTALDEVEKGRFSLHDKIKVSYYASRQPRTSADLRYGEEVSVKNLLLLSGVVSANDAAYALAEGIGDASISSFIEKMNQNSVRSNMYNTNFFNPTGLHDELQYSSPQDIVFMMRQFSEKYPGYTGILNANGFFYRGKLYKSRSLLGTGYKCIQIFKTGFTLAAGYNIAMHVKCGKYNIAVVGLGFRTAWERDINIAKVLDYSMEKRGKNIDKNDRGFYVVNQSDPGDSLSIKSFMLPLKISSVLMHTQNVSAINSAINAIEQISRIYLDKNIEYLSLSTMPVPRKSL